MPNITELKLKCSTIEQCLPVSDFREQVAKTHSEMFEYISALEAERDQSRSLERQYSGQLGEIARLSNSVCRWVLRNPPELTPTGIAVAAADVLQYVELVMPNSQHFGITDRFAGTGKVMEEGNSVRN